MPLAVREWDVESKRLHLEGADIVTLDDWLTLVDRLAIEGAWCYAVQYDGRRRVGHGSRAELRVLAEFGARLASRYGRPGPMAIVRMDPVGFGMARVFEAFSASHRAVAVFREERDAARWLDETIEGSADDALLAELAREQREVAAGRLELTLWTLVRADQRAEARTRRHPAGIELVVTIDGEPSYVKAFEAKGVDVLQASAAAMRRAFEADGWTLSGPRP